MTELDSASDRVGTLRTRFFQTEGYPDDGGSSSRWVRYPLGPVQLVLPNVAARRRALPLHDLHHLATGYATSWTGESEIAAWELGAGCHGYAAAWALNLAAFTIGLAIAPRRLWRAFIRGRSGTTLYRHHWRDEYLEWRLEELQAFVGVTTLTRAPNIGDAARFVAVALPGLIAVGLLVAMLWALA